MLSGSGDGTVRVWDTEVSSIDNHTFRSISRSQAEIVETQTPLHILKGHTSWVLVVSWSPDGSIIATGRSVLKGMRRHLTNS